MSSPYSGGCDQVKIVAIAEPIDNHVCHCNVGKFVPGRQTTHVAFFNHGKLKGDHEEKMNRHPTFKHIAASRNIGLKPAIEESRAPLLIEDKQSGWGWVFKAVSNKKPPPIARRGL